MTIKELIKKLLDVPADMEKATITFQDGRLVVTSSGSGDSECFLIE